MYERYDRINPHFFFLDRLLSNRGNNVRIVLRMEWHLGFFMAMNLQITRYLKVLRVPGS